MIPFLAFPPGIRKSIYTTNATENINSQLSKIIKAGGTFPATMRQQNSSGWGFATLLPVGGRSRLGGGDEPIRYPLCDRFFEHPCECRSEKRGALPRATLCSCTGLWLRLRSLFSLHIPCILDSKITDKFKHFRLTYLKFMLIINNSDTIQSKGRFHHAS